MTSLRQLAKQYEYVVMCVCVCALQHVCLFAKKVEDEVKLEKGSHVRVVTAQADKDSTDGKNIWVDYPDLPRVLKNGDKIYIDDGLIGLKVLETGTK